MCNADIGVTVVTMHCFSLTHEWANAAGPQHITTLFWFTPHSWFMSPHPNARIHKPLFQLPHSINRSPQHIPPVELPSAGTTLGIYLSVGRNTSLWIGCLVFPIVVLICNFHQTIMPRMYLPPLPFCELCILCFPLSSWLLQLSPGHHAQDVPFPPLPFCELGVLCFLSSSWLLQLSPGHHAQDVPFPPLPFCELGVLCFPSSSWLLQLSPGHHAQDVPFPTLPFCELGI